MAFRRPTVRSRSAPPEFTGGQREPLAPFLFPGVDGRNFPNRNRTREHQREKRKGRDDGEIRDGVSPRQEDHEEGTDRNRPGTTKDGAREQRRGPAAPGPKGVRGDGRGGEIHRHRGLRLMLRRLLIAGVAAAICVVGAGSPEAFASPPAGKSFRPLPGAPVVTGTVSLGKTPSHEQAPLPGMAMVRVELLDISGKNPLASPLGEDTIWAATGKLPIDFRIAYDPSRVDPSHVYIVRARVMEGEKVLFLNTTPYYVLTRGAPSNIDIIVIPAQVRVR
ncbi:MAG: hypothetical protein FIA93_00500 [Deltaproteobacteria bacterium]|nr:hypothetical protein [Deltaproteobacteria bacterium]